MLQANIPNITPNISLAREKSIKLILASIALEELDLGEDSICNWNIVWIITSCYVR
ncbi:hypothetical protein ACQGRZ_27980 [Bacillus wiedmannii]|uniref:hypothetical protein n=1 Tax=Bacillus wiedmannii TaxID=1890302 RepID=UPI003CF8E90D